MNIDEIAILLRGVPGLLRTTPPWIVGIVALALIVMVIAAGPLLGRALIARQRRELGEVFKGNGVYWNHGSWDETGQIPKVTEEPKRTLQPSPVQVIRDDRVTQAIKSRLSYVPPKPQTVEWVEGIRLVNGVSEANPVRFEPVVISSPSWASGGTEALDILEYVDGQMVEAETQAEQQFRADPLGSWVLPPEVEFRDDSLPTAQDAFEFLVLTDRLSGEGFGIDAEWEAWNLYEKDEVFA